MLRTWVRGRHGAAVLAASAAIACLGAVAALGGGDGPDGYAAVGAAGGSSAASGPGATPTGGVRLVPLDPAEPGSPRSPQPRGPRRTPTAPASPDAKDPERPAETPAQISPGTDSDSAQRATGSGGRPGSAAGSGSGNNSPGQQASSAPPNHPAPSPAGPAKLTVSAPALKATDHRWCQDVTLTLRNSGGSAVRSGTVTFGTHIIGSLGIDWATIESHVKLPAPLGAGEERKKTWTVCVESWRVPLGMHVETRVVSVDWK